MNAIQAILNQLSSIRPTATGPLDITSAAPQPADNAAFTTLINGNQPQSFQQIAQSYLERLQSVENISQNGSPTNTQSLNAFLKNPNISDSPAILQSLAELAAINNLQNNSVVTPEVTSPTLQGSTGVETIPNNNAVPPAHTSRAGVKGLQTALVNLLEAAQDADLDPETLGQIEQYVANNLPTDNNVGVPSDLTTGTNLAVDTSLLDDIQQVIPGIGALSQQASAVAGQRVNETGKPTTSPQTLLNNTTALATQYENPTQQNPTAAANAYQQNGGQQNTAPNVNAGVNFTAPESQAQQGAVPQNIAGQQTAADVNAPKTHIGTQVQSAEDFIGNPNSLFNNLLPKSQQSGEAKPQLLQQQNVTSLLKLQEVSGTQPVAGNPAIDPLNDLVDPEALTTQRIGDVAGKADAAAKAELPQQAQQANVANQINLRVAQAIQNNERTIKLQLYPSDLGEVDIELSLNKQGKVTMSMTFEKQDTLDMMRQDARALERMLQQSGLNADAGSLNFGLKDQQSNNQYSANTNPYGGIGNDEVDSVPPPEVIKHYQVTTGLDIRV